MTWEWLTEPAPEKDRLWSQWGLVTYLEWCHRERQRINRPSKIRIARVKGHCWLEFEHERSDSFA